MQIAPDTVVAIHFSLSDQDGNPLESSRRDQPLTYLHGHGMLVPGLEKALLGRQSGDSFSVVLEPAEAYGEVDPSLRQSMPRSAFPVDASIEPGQHFHARTSQGISEVIVISVDTERVVIDGNHELAGKTLAFAIEVLTVRPATPDEIAHGHPHHSGCCHH